MRTSNISESITEAITRPASHPNSFLTFFSLFHLKLVRFRPEDFERLRSQIWGIEECGYKLSFRLRDDYDGQQQQRQVSEEDGLLGNATGDLVPVGDLGYSGSTFFNTPDGKYLIKSLPRSFEYLFFTRTLFDPYVEHMVAHAESLLARITDLPHAPHLTLGGVFGLAPTHHIVMENLLHGKKGEEEVGWETFDLKPHDYFFPERDIADGHLAPDSVNAHPEFYEPITSINVIDPLTVKFFFRKPSPGFLQGTSVIGSGLVALQTLERPFDELGDATKIIGSGPFVVASETLGKELVLSARKDYSWGPAQLAHQGRARLDEVRFIVTPEDSVRIGALLSGQAGVIRQVQAYDEKRVEEQKFVIYAPSTRGVNNSIVFRPDNALVADLKVRQALLHATNTQEVVQTLFSHNYPQATSVIASSALGYVNLASKLAYDPQQAQQLLESAGWTPGPDGIRQKDGRALVLAAYDCPAFKPWLRALYILLAGLICASTLFIKQHSILDVIAGVLLAVPIYFLVYAPARRKKAQGGTNPQ